jgi:hypothetical protein
MYACTAGSSIYGPGTVTHTYEVSLHKHQKDLHASRVCLNHRYSNNLLKRKETQKFSYKLMRLQLQLVVKCLIGFILTCNTIYVAGRRQSILLYMRPNIVKALHQLQ